MRKYEWPVDQPEPGRYVVAWTVMDGGLDVTEAILGYDGKCLKTLNAWDTSDFEPNNISDRQRCFWFYADELINLERE